MIPVTLDHPKIASVSLVCIASRNIDAAKAFMGIISISDGKYPDGAEANRRLRDFLNSL